MCQCRDHRDRVRRRGSVHDADIFRTGNALDQSFGCNSLNRLLARRINVEQANRIGIGEGGSEFIHKIASTSKEMRLEDDMYASESALSSARESGPNFGRVMPVIVNHANASGFALELKAPVHAAKPVKSRTDLFDRNVERN